MRLFIAIELPEIFAEQVAGLSRELACNIEGRFLRRDTYHITLAFIGDAPSSDVGTISQILENACEGIGPIALVPSELGKFGRASDATLWLGLTPQANMAKLSEQVRAGLKEHDIAFDDKKFLPHITLCRRARIPKGGLGQLCFPLGGEAVEVTLFKSTLSKDGAEYEPLHTVYLDEG